MHKSVFVASGEHIISVLHVINVFVDLIIIDYIF